MAKVCRVLVCTVLVFVLFSMSTLSAPSAGAQDESAGIDGDSYTSPTFGYTLSWDAGTWEATDEFSEDGYDFLLIESDGASVYIEGVYFYQGDPSECLEGERLRVAEEAGLDDVEPWLADGEPIEGDGKGFEYAVVDVPESADGEIPASAVYIECRTLVDNSVVLILTAFVDPDDFDFQLENVIELANTLESPAVPAARLDVGDVEQIMRQTVADVNELWEQIFADLGEVYVAPTVIAVTGPTETECGDAFPAESGSFYCPADQTIYMDVPDSIENDLSYGVVFFQVVIAHEVAHHVQELLLLPGCFDPTCGEPESSLAIELQADCFAGAWMQDAAANGEIDEQELERVEIAVKTFLGDPIDVPADDPDAHGTGDQRFDMFMAGYEDGVAACGL